MNKFQNIRKKTIISNEHPVGSLPEDYSLRLCKSENIQLKLRFFCLYLLQKMPLKGQKKLNLDFEDTRYVFCISVCPYIKMNLHELFLIDHHMLFLD